MLVWEDATGKRIEGPHATMMTIDAVEDLDGDGHADALVSTSEGGNCCPDRYFVASVAGGKIETADFEEDWAEYRIVHEKGHPLIRVKRTNGTEFYAFAKGKLRLDHKQASLATLAEIEGEAPHYDGPLKDKTLRYDIDGDGKPEAIVCQIWERWGSLLCGLPLPGGRTQSLSTGCDRFGVLASQRNGRHEFVCNNDSRIFFDGRAWQFEKAD